MNSLPCPARAERAKNSAAPATIASSSTAPVKPQFAKLLRAAVVCLASVALASRAGPALAQIYYTFGSPNSGQVIPGTEGITPGPGVDLGGWNSPGHELEFADLSDFYFYYQRDISLSNASFANSDLHAANLNSTDLTSANFVGADLTNASLSAANLTNADFSNANLSDASFSSPYYYRHGTVLTNANFSGAIVRGADFSGGGFNTFAGGANLTAGQLYSTGSYASHDLAGIGLESLDLTGWNLANQNLTSANLANSVLTNASFANANLSNAKVYGSALTGADFTNAVLSNVNFSTLNLTNVVFTGAIVKGTDFGGPGSFVGGPGLTASQLYSTAS
jgi:uncharacterized protein YjbI with pentapeptide repeats